MLLFTLLSSLHTLRCFQTLFLARTHFARNLTSRFLKRFPFNEHDSCLISLYDTTHTNTHTSPVRFFHTLSRMVAIALFPVTLQCCALTVRSLQCTSVRLRVRTRNKLEMRFGVAQASPLHRSSCYAASLSLFSARSLSRFRSHGGVRVCVLSLRFDVKFSHSCSLCCSTA